MDASSDGVVATRQTLVHRGLDAAVGDLALWMSRATLSAFWGLSPDYLLIKFLSKCSEIFPFGAVIVVTISTNVFGHNTGKGRPVELPFWVGVLMGSKSFNAIPISLRCKSVLCIFIGGA